MPSLVDDSGLRRLFGGAAVALVAGLALGAAMRPDLGAGERPEGPQILAGVSAPRAQPFYDAGAAWAAYRNGTPDYVIGTDWLKPPTQEALLTGEPPAIPPEAETIAFAEEPPPAPEPVRRWEEPPREPVTYPSISGNVPTASDLPPPPPPPDETAAG